MLCVLFISSVSGIGQEGAKERPWRRGRIGREEGLTILQVHLDGRPIRRLAHPNVQVFPLARLEEEHIVAIVELGQLVQLVELGFRVKFGVFAAVGKEGVDVIKEMSVSVGHAAGGEDEDALTGESGSRGIGGALRCGGGVGGGFGGGGGEGLVCRGHLVTGGEISDAGGAMGANTRMCGPLCNGFSEWGLSCGSKSAILWAPRHNFGLRPRAVRSR